ncbi:auxin efflux carrier [Caballeronia ptereochthonis]|uniref:Auxin efflux carrier n=1 Tax=Caballeronia ptereochthonis TaxID=1777144 RepID=A0A158D665_9BURK|nr:auxin efflux carrier [Caballeronia ptereochthonis]
MSAGSPSHASRIASPFRQGVASRPFLSRSTLFPHAFAGFPVRRNFLAAHSALQIILPVFGLIFAGYACRKLNKLGPAAASELNRFVVYLALPALLFDIMAKTPWSMLDQPAFQTEKRIAATLGHVAKSLAKSPCWLRSGCFPAQRAKRATGALVSLKLLAQPRLTWWLAFHLFGLPPLCSERRGDRAQKNARRGSVGRNHLLFDGGGGMAQTASSESF